MRFEHVLRASRSRRETFLMPVPQKWTLPRIRLFHLDRKALLLVAAVVVGEEDILLESHFWRSCAQHREKISYCQPLWY